MGIGGMLGIKSETLKLKGSYAGIEEFYEKIKDVEFEAGKPLLIKYGFVWMIVFPPVDRNNQVQIIGNKGKFTVQRSVQPANMDSIVSNMVLDKLTDGWSGMSGAFGDAKKRCMELVTMTADTIHQLGI